jgi:hypothetical protein
MKYSEWLKENREELIELYRNDYEFALFKAFLAGMDYAGSYLNNPLTTISEYSITKE